MKIEFTIYKIGISWLAGLYIIALSFKLSALSINLTPSMPRGLWKSTHYQMQHLSRGTVVRLCLPDSTILSEAIKRGYFHVGNCPHGVAPLLKPIAAIEGDHIMQNETGIFVNHQLIQNSRPHHKDRRGHPLSLFKQGSWIIPKGEYLVLSTYSAYSFDSRYFGPIPARSIKQIANPLWTEDVQPTL